MAVAFDAATSAQEIAGDGVMSLSHTSTGSNLAGFAGVSAAKSGGGLTNTSCTFGAASMTNKWDFNDGTVTDFRNAGFTVAGQASGSQTVTSTLNTAPYEHALQVISLIGVDQTTPVGTAVTDSDFFAANASVTVGSVGASDMIVDNLYVGETATPDADQTQRTHETLTLSVETYTSTQPGSAGGIMSWTHGANIWTLGAIAFKPAATSTQAPRSEQQYRMRRQ